MVDSVALRTKFHRPVVGQELIHRPRLHALLGDAWDEPLRLVTASAGYGKTVAVSHWTESQPVPCAWLSLEETETDLTHFVRYLVAAVRIVHPAAFPWTHALLVACRLPPLPVLADTLANEIDAIGTSFVLVLDDYHRIAPESQVHCLLDRLLAYPPPTLRLVIVSRREPPLGLPGLRARNRLIEVRQNDLRFTDEEAAAMIETETGCAIGADALTTLQHKVEGWASGLRLVAQAACDGGITQDLLRQLPAGVDTIRTYLIREGFEAQTPAMQDWMLKTAILSRFCAGLCEAVCAPGAGAASADPGGAGFLRQLQRESLFTLALDTQDTWFRYHHLFQQELREELGRRMNAEAIAALHLRASVWLADAGLTDEAIQHALAGGDAVRAARLVEAHRFDESPAVAPWHLAARWLPRLPERLTRARRGLLMAQAWLFYAQHKPAKIATLLESATLAGADSEADPLLRGEMSFFRGLVSFYRIDDAHSRACFEDALANIPDSCAGMRGCVQLHYAASLQKAGEAESALRLLERLTGTTGGCMSSALARQQTALVTIYLLEADLPLARREVVFFGGPAQHSADTPILGFWRYLAASISFHRNEFSEALQVLEPNVENRFSLYRRVAMDSLAIQALGAQALGDTAKAAETIAVMDEIATHSGDRECYGVARSCEARIALLTGDLPRAIECVQAIDDALDVEYMAVWAETPRLTKCRVLIAQDSTASCAIALARLEHYQGENRVVHNKLKLIEILTLKALALQGLGRSGDAITALREALVLASPGGVLRAFVEPGEAMVNLLLKLKPGADDAPFVQRILAASGRFAVPTSTAVSDFPCVLAGVGVDAPADLPEHLTRREGDVLRLLAMRLSDKEIAGQLGISPKTVNSHLKRIYQKLEVRGRREAAVRAKSLGILLDRRATARSVVAH